LDPETRGAKPKDMTREPGNDQIVVENGIVKQVDQETKAKQVLTGDVDLYQVGKADGSPFSQVGDRDEFDELMDGLIEADLAEHDAHLLWNTRSPKEARIKKSIIDKHEAGERLIEFGPQGAKLVEASDVPGHSAAVAGGAK
ncbi:MAG: hypothetical protein ACC726_09080, partial [Chloroflexota bacterium]